MEIKASGSDVETPSGRKNPGSSRSSGATDPRSNPRSRRINRSARADGFAAFSKEVLRDLNPRGPLQSVVADHIVLSAWKLKDAVARQAAQLPSKSENPDRPDVKIRRASVSAADLAARSVKEGLESLDRARSVRRDCEGAAPVETYLDLLNSEFEPNGGAIADLEQADERTNEISATGEELAPIWSGRLVFDFDISEESPVVKGTWITVGHVVSLIVDGNTWADILRSHPELTESDIRVCVAYAVAQDHDED